jgi:DNA-binding Lrp family transcriptional regulator
MAEAGSSLGVSSNTIWRKLKEWRQSGFMRGFLILPHPQLLGIGLSVFCVHLAGPVEKQEFLSSLELIDGVLFSSTDVGSRVNLVVVADREAAQKRRKELISRVPGVTAVGATHKVWLPECHGFLSPIDWKLILALRSAPYDSIASLADKADLSSRTVSRHLLAFRKTNAVLSHALEDWTQFPGTVVGIHLELKQGADSPGVRRRFQSEVPNSLEMAWLDFPPGGPDTVQSYLVPVSSGPIIDSILRRALGIGGVTKATHSFPGTERGYSGWIDERIELVRHRGT